MTGEGECMERLQKVIAASGITSRRKAEQYIVEGRVKVNGEVVDRLGAQVKKGDIIEVDGEQIIRENKVYYLMNKPKRTLCASSDDRGRQTVIDLMDCEERVFSVGRLEDLVIRALRDQSGLFCPFPCQNETVVVAGIR